MAILFKRTYLVLISFQLVIICGNILSVDAGCDKNGLVGEGNGISCKVVDHKIHSADADAPPSSSFDCVTDLENSIVVYTDGDVTLECFAAFPLELDYDGVQPAEHIHLEFSKRGLAFEPNPVSDIYVAAIHLKNVGHVIWSANYLFHEVKKGGDILMMSVFVEKKEVPWFLPLGDGPVMAYLYPSGSHIVLPCRVQNHDSVVGLYKDYLPLELDENIEFDPKKGFIRKILEDEEEEIYGEYECYIEKGGDVDRQKVLAVQTDPVDPPTKPRKDTKDYGQLKFIQTEDRKSMAMCMTTKEQDEIRKTKGNAPFLNAGFNNPGILKLKAACLYEADEKTGRHCPGRKFGKHVDLSGIKPGLSNPIAKLIPFENVTEHDNVYEIHPIHPEGGIQCGHNRKQYFTGTDKNIYYSYSVAAEKNALVKVESLDEDTNFLTNGWYGFNCTYVSYVLVLPVWWKLKFSDGTIKQEFATNSSAKYFELSPNAVQVACSLSAWNSSQWFESTLDIRVTSPDTLEKPMDSTKVYFRLNDKNQVLPCKGTGTPTPSLKWLKNGEEDATLVTTLEEDTLLLTFPSVAKSDEATYTCVAHSETATIEVKFLVSVGEESSQGVPPPTDGRTCSLIMTLYKNGTSEEINDVSLVQTGDVILVRFAPNCSQDGLVGLNFTAGVGAIKKKESGSPEEIARRNSDAVAEGTKRKCGTFFSLHSVETGKEITPDFIKDGDTIFIRVSEKDCSDGQNGETDLSVSVSELVPHSEHEGDMPFSKTVGSLIFVFFCILLILLISLCACYCMDRPHKIYHVNR